ncbi:MAG: hypothetical protein LBV79_02170 [Candidatus Adiutrix sp.]|jgi:predicted hotdog family 3-hydroxylacyl-ACP dehydratase|nr:hypothetical protein [Candidatus Adiutrix sp.]
MTVVLPMNIEGLIPHRPPMLLVDRLVELSADEAVSETVFGPGSLVVREDGRVEEAALFEMMAQTFAAFAAAGREGPGPAAGFLVGLKRLTVHSPARIGSPVLVRVKIISRVEDFSVVEGEARQGGQLLAAGQITVFVPEEAAV